MKNEPWYCRLTDELTRSRIQVISNQSARSEAKLPPFFGLFTPVVSAANILLSGGAGVMFPL